MDLTLSVKTQLKFANPKQVVGLIAISGERREAITSDRGLCLEGGECRCGPFYEGSSCGTFKGCPLGLSPFVCSQLMKTNNIDTKNLENKSGISLSDDFGFIFDDYGKFGFDQIHLFEFGKPGSENTNSGTKFKGSSFNQGKPSKSDFQFKKPNNFIQKHNKKNKNNQIIDKYSKFDVLLPYFER